jgi:predicted nucleic acid-binding protein
MARYVIGPDVALRLAQDRVVINDDHRLLAPTLLRNQVLSLLFQAVGRGECTRAEAEQRLAHTRGLQIRLLGDRVLQKVAWDVAERLGWADTFRAEYIALTLLQADALVTLDEGLGHEVEDLVTVVPFAALL